MVGIVMLNQPPCRPIRRMMQLHPLPLLALSALLLVVGCGNINCPSDRLDVNGDCVPLEDLCPAGEVFVDGGCVMDGDCENGDTRSCGDDVGECAAGTQTCANGAWQPCEGEVGPSDEVCDGLDNDCDGIPDNGAAETCDGIDNDCDDLVDEGVLSVKEGEVEDGVSSITAVGDYFFRGKWDDTALVQAYDLQGNVAGSATSLANHESSFGSMIASNSVIYTVFRGSNDDGFKPEVVRMSVSGPQATVTHRNNANQDWVVATFGVTGAQRLRIGLSGSDPFLASGGQFRPFGNATLSGVDDDPVLHGSISDAAPFDIERDSQRLLWASSGTVRIAALFPAVGTTILDRQVGPGAEGAVALDESREFLGVLVREVSNSVKLYELPIGTHDCATGRLCNRNLGQAEGPLDITQHHNTWFAVAGERIWAIGPDGTKLVNHSVTFPGEVDDVQIAHNGTTTAVVQSSITTPHLSAEPVESKLTFIGCFDP